MRGSPQMTPECPSWSSAPWLLIWGGRSSSLSTIGLGFTSCKSGKKQDWPYVETYWSRRMGTWGSPCLLLYFYIRFEFSIMRKVLRLCYNLLKLAAGENGKIVLIWLLVTGATGRTMRKDKGKITGWQPEFLEGMELWLHANMHRALAIYKRFALA